MAEIHNIKGMAQALEEGEMVTCTKNGEWTQKNFFGRLVIKFIGLQEKHLINLARSLNASLDELEKQNLNSIDGEIQEKYHSHYMAARIVNECFRRRTKLKFHRERWELKRRTLAMLYRCEKIQPDAVADPEILAKIKTIAQSWLRKQLLSAPEQEMSDLHLSRLEELCRYKKLAQMVIKEYDLTRAGVTRNRPLQYRCFRWLITNHNHANILAEFPALQEDFRKNMISSHLGFDHENYALRVEKHFDPNGAEVKDVQLQIEVDSKGAQESSAGEWVSLLGTKQQREERTVTFRGNYSLKLPEIFKDFHSKNVSWGKLEIFGGKVCNWNAGKMARFVDGTYQPIDLSTSEWWKNLPQAKWMSVEDTQKLYPNLNLDQGRNWIGVTIGTRQFPDKRVHGTHAFRMVMIPNDENGQPGYHMYTFGKFPREEGWPTSAREALHCAANLAEAEIASPDPNMFGTHRQRGGVAFSMTPEEGLVEMDQLKRDIQRGRDLMEFFYNVFCKNCAMWARKWRSRLGDERVPKGIFDAKVEESEPMFPVNIIFSGLKYMPSKVQHKIYEKVFTTLGGANTVEMQFKKDGQIVKRELSVISRGPWKEGQRYLIPESLFHQAYCVPVFP